MVVGMTVFSSTFVSLGTIVSGSANTWVVSVGGTFASQTMSAATVGASVPTAADSVFFDQAATYTINSSGALACLDLTISAGTVSFAFSGSATFAISGSMTLLSSAYWGTGGTITFNSTSSGKTITTNGATIRAHLVFNGVGGAWTLGSALTATGGSGGDIFIQNGTFSTSASNYSLTASSITVQGGTLTLNGSTATLGGAAPFTYTAGTFNVGTSQINLNGSNLSTFSGGSRTFYNVSFTGTTSTMAAGPTINGANTFNNLTVNPRTATSGIGSLTLSANQTVNGTLTFAGNADAGYRMAVKSSIFGTTRTLTCAAVSLVDVDFQDITGAGAAAPFTGTRLGDGKGNSGITFPAAKTVYWNLAAGGNWSATGWAATSGGTPATANFPLAQDTAIFEATGLTSGTTITVNSSYFIGTIDMSARTSNTMTLESTNAIMTIIGNWVNGTGVTPTSGALGFYQFSGRGSQTITSAGRSFDYIISINSPGGTVTLQDALTNSGAVAGVLTLTNGTLDLNGKTLTLSAAATATFLTAAGTKNLTFNGGTLSIATTGATAFNNAVPTGFTTTAGTGTGTISLTSASAKTFVGGGSTYNCTINQGGAGALTITGSNSFSDITNTRNTVSATSILFTAGTTSTFTNWNANGAFGKLLTIGSVTAASHTLSKASGTVNASFLSISRSTATGGATWNALTTNGNVNGGNNAGWILSLSSGNFMAFFM